VKLRLASEEKRLRMVAGEQTEMPLHPSVMSPLYELLSRLPTDVQFHVTQLRLGEGKLFLEGEAKSHGDADALAAALRTDHAFEIEPPRTELTPHGVLFTLNGSTPTVRPAREEEHR
jgi:hypothetical protein